MIFKRIIVSIIFLLTTSLVSQEINIPKNITKSYNDNQFIYFFTKNNYFKVDVASYNISKPIEFNNNGFDINNFTPFKINDVFYFVQNVGGLVLKLNKNDLIRIDKSFTHKMQISSSIFIYKNEIYRYGGYGFFSVRELIVKFDFETSEWESVKVNRELIPRARYSNAFSIDENNLTIIGGETIDRYNREKRLRLTDMWQFSFEELKWSFILDSEDILAIDSDAYIFDNKILFREGNYLKSLNLDSYELSTNNLTNTLLKVSDRFKVHYFDGNFHFVVNRNNGERVLISRSKKELLGTSKFLKSLKNKKLLSVNNLIIIGLLLFVIITIFFLMRYLNTVILKINKIKFRNKTVFISEEEYIVLKEFFRNQNSLENNILQNLVNKDQYERSHNVRRKNNLINILNSKLQILFNNNNSFNYIEIKKSDFDKRYKRYFLNLNNLKTIVVKK
jgi:hypothetical protein